MTAPGPVAVLGFQQGRPGTLLAPAEPGAPAWVWQPGGTGPPAGGTTWHPCGSVPERLTT